ncbi:MAG TPA: DUF4157 domain-containing protein [Longimicrobium sp.]|jgi:hypothetical protein|nr:DUF4157 domain-containing protein [Longimicrobium sp.]
MQPPVAATKPAKPAGKAGKPAKPGTRGALKGASKSPTRGGGRSGQPAGPAGRGPLGDPDALLRRLVAQAGSYGRGTVPAPGGGPRSAPRPPPATVSRTAPRLQRCGCGGSCPKCRAAAAAREKEEQPRMAAQSVTLLGPRLQRCAEAGCRGHDEVSLAEEPPLTATSPRLQRKARGPRAAASETGAVAAVLRASGQPLDSATRSSMERGFGRDFAHVRLHTGTAAADAAASLHARAFTYGRDIAFGAGQYAPHSREGRRLIAHELAHTVQQGGGAAASPPSVQTFSFGGSTYDALEREADRIAARVVDGAGAGPLSAAGPGVQRFDWPSWDDIEQGASDAWDSAVSTGGEALAWAGETASDAWDAASEAVSWLATEAGELALAGANALVGLWGGSVTIRGGCLVVSIPSITLFPSFQKTLGETPPVGFFVPLIEGGAMIGPIPIAGMAGFMAYAQASIEAAVGPGELRNISFSVCPFATTASATAQLYAAAALAPRITLFGGAFAAAGTVIPFDPPIPIIAIIQAGLRGTGTGWMIGAIRDTVTLAYASGRLSFSNLTTLQAGVLLQGDLDFFAAVRLYDKIVCQYVYPLLHWEGGRAWELNIPLHAGIGRGGASGGVGPITHGPIPVSSIETVIRGLPRGLNCLSWQEVKRFLCDRGVIPKRYCDDEPGGAHVLRKQLALAICKCVGKDTCGGGKIYRKCFEVDSNICSNGHPDLQKAADKHCNHDPDLTSRCVRSGGCRFRHTDARCPVKEKDCKDGHFGGAGGQGGVGPAAPCAVPTNFRQTAGRDAGGGVLHFEYAFDSSTGVLADLSACEVGENVTYPNGDPYKWPSPPWDGGTTPNPTVIWVPATPGKFQDNHSSKGFKKPYKRATFQANQIYRYRTPCKNSGNPVAMSRNITIARAVTEPSTGHWKYRITKSGKAAEIDPLP